MSHTPDVITRYFGAAERGDVDQILACFTDDAWVIDEGIRHDGKNAIRTWRTTSSSAYTYTLEVRDTTARGDNKYAVDTHLEGNFPGGVADLQHVFTLRGDLIASLVI
jgi:ketosteroid isomerase-like protein